jgi:macrodomain Ter protein organizer (MatP/YcbG family)
MEQQRERKKAWTKWRKLVNRQSKSGESVTAYCQARGLSAPQFFYWKKKLRELEANQFVEVKMVSSRMPPEAAGAGIEVRLRNDIRLQVPRGFDADHLQALLVVLESRA